MNTNTGIDPMLSGFTCEDWTKLSLGAAYPSPSPLPSLSQAVDAFTIHVEGLISPEPNSAFTDLSSLWMDERKRVTSIHMDRDEELEGVDRKNTLSSGSCSSPPEIGMDDIDVGSNTTIEIKSEVDDSDFNDDNLSPINSEDSFEAVSPVGAFNTLQMTEKEARKYVEEQFERIAFLPNSSLTQREKINFILGQSDCKEFTVDDVLNFDKRKSESARACAKIVQNIPQHYRWECVEPEDIPCCYTIVADCKKVSSRDKPPRPMNAFMIWAQGARRLINELCPKMQNALISEALGYYWRLKSDSFKQRFEQEKVKLRRFHNVEFPAYKYKPKTKVQKAKEKQELSLSKAKLRASQKRERAQKLKCDHPGDASELHKKRLGVKCGRPKKNSPPATVNSKVKTDIVFSTANGLSKDSRSKVSRSHGRERVQMSPTKPAIKDMLTLKILNDRRSKECSSVNSTPQPQVHAQTTAKDTVHSIFGQLSPLEMAQPAIGDILEELNDFENFLDDKYTAQSSHDKLQPSSVYDTPANTPPADEDDQPQHFLSSGPFAPPISATSSSSLHMSSSPAMSLLSTPHSSLSPLKVTTDFPSVISSTPMTATASNSSCSSRTQILMPSLSAMLSSPVKNSPFSSNIQNIPASASTAGTHFTIAAANPGMAKARAGFSNILSLKWVGKNNGFINNLQSQNINKPNISKGGPLFAPVENKTNINSAPVINKIICSKPVDNKRTVLTENLGTGNGSFVYSPLGAPPSYAMSVMNLKVVGTVADTYDLDSLSLDPNVPLLSEDVMRSYIDSL
ncbi:sex-determining region y protein [Plakobranchus ocellatus]|uniref:Sex-determining region y protein n=1 Tax=Plakobranchus ocellatus TaxID=259542 RepID=A0AAV3Z704_9GAST|nr:sex-determining region y protein [Plakobranchus ocellatus]